MSIFKYSETVERLKNSLTEQKLQQFLYLNVRARIIKA